MEKVWATVDGCGFIELELPMYVVKQCAHSGECSCDVEECLKLPEIRKQMDAFSDEILVKSINEIIGEAEMSRHEMESFILWTACFNVVDES